MFEFHWWAVIRVRDEDDEDSHVVSQREKEATERVRSAIGSLSDGLALFDVRLVGNGMIVLYAHGLRNHRYQPVIDLFRWVAEVLPDSYGLLYVQDDEDYRRDGDYTNTFQVWRMARGSFGEHSDPFLSPYIPTVEAPYEPGP